MSWIKVTLAPLRHKRIMREITLEEAALNLLRQALGAGATPEIARDVVLRKLAGLFRQRRENELRDALAHAWAIVRRAC